MTLQLLHSEFPYILGKFDFLFYQCTVYSKVFPPISGYCSPGSPGGQFLYYLPIIRYQLPAPLS
jgi:hypothetical protein